MLESKCLVDLKITLFCKNINTFNVIYIQYCICK